MLQLGQKCSEQKSLNRRKGRARVTFRLQGPSFEVFDQLLSHGEQILRGRLRAVAADGIRFDVFVHLFVEHLQGLLLQDPVLVDRL